MKITHSNPFSPIPFLLFLLQLQLAFSYISTGNQIRDLFRSDTCFKQEAGNWSMTAPLGQPIDSICDGTYLLGGYQVLGNGGQNGEYFYITYNNLPTHTMIYFSFNMYAIDNWQSETFTVDFVSSSFLSWGNFDKAAFDQNYCGVGSKDLKDIRVFGKAAHTASSVTMKVISHMTQHSGNRAFGFREVELLFVNLSPVPTGYMCGVASITITPSSLSCGCSVGSYYNGATCLPCHSSCSSCFGPGASGCYACKKGYSWNGANCFGCDVACESCYGLLNTECRSCNPGYLLFQNHTCVPSSLCVSPLLQTWCNTYCESPCANVNDYLYWNNTCLSTCNFPHPNSTILNTLKTCIYPCQNSEYLYWDGTCSAVCNFPLLVRVEVGKNYCDYPCLITEFVYWNGTCASGCLFPLTQGTIGGRQFCYYLCADTEFLYWDGTCSSSCTSPLTQRTEGGKKYCHYPCLSTQYLYWDGTCGPTCPFPYHQKTEWGSFFCNHPCPGTQYLYWDAVCEASCPPPFLSSSIGLKNYCNSPCGAGQYLYWNTTCIGTCDPPHVQKFRAEVNYCEYPCTAGQYLYMNGSCINNCKLPFRLRLESGKNYCDAICPTGTDLFYDGSCIDSCDSPLRYSTNTSGTYCNVPCNSPLEYYYEDTKQCRTTCDGASLYQNGWYLKCLAPGDTSGYLELALLLHHIRYLNIKFPPKLQFISANRQMNLFSIRVVSSMFDPIREHILKTAKVYKFEKYIFSISFLANLLDELILMGIILSLGIAFGLLELISHLLQLLYPQIIFERLRVLTLWNLMLILITVNAGDIILFASLEFRSINTSSISANVSFGLCLVMAILTVAVYAFNMWIIYKIQAFKTQALKSTSNDFYTDYLLKWEICQVLFRGFKDTSILTHSFYLIYALRLSLPMAIASFLPMIPILQAVFYVVISLVVVWFLVYYKPIKNKVCQINLILLEIIILIANLCILVMTIFDYCGKDIYGGTKFLGDVIIAMNFCINLLAIVFLPIKIVEAVKYALLLRRKCASEELGAWLQLLFIPIQQGGLGFEQVQVVSAFTISRIKTAINKKKTAPSKETPDVNMAFKPLSGQPNLNLTPQVSNDTAPKNQGESFELSATTSNPGNIQQVDIEGESQQMHKYKRRRYNANAYQPEKTFDTIQEFSENMRNEDGNENDDNLPTRLQKVNDYAPGTVKSQLAPQKPVKKFENNLDLSQLTPLNLQTTPSYDLNRESRYRNGGDDYF